MTSLQAANAARRAKLAGPSGIQGVLQNGRLLRLAAITTLGALCYGYEQGSYSQVLVMSAFTNDPRFSRIVNDSSYKGWNVSTLGLGGWAGSLSNGYLCDIISRRWTLLLGALICCFGTGLTAGAQNAAYIFVGRFFIGWAVGSLSAVVPLVGFGTNYISETNSASWRVCLALQGVPALLLAALTLTLPYTPRWLVSRGRLDEALRTLSWLRRLPEDSEAVQLEFIEIRAEAMFEAETTAIKFPHLVGPGAFTRFKLQVNQFAELFKTIHMFRRTAVACLTQFFQQMSGIDCIIYYAPTIFESLNLPGKTVSLLASGVIGVVFVISTLPAIATIDKIGRRPLLIMGGIGMAIMLILVAALTATYQPDWSNTSAAWSTAVFIWLYVGFFGASWGPVSWTVISEVFPLSTRAHGVALGASTNWITNFVVSIIVPIMLKNITYGTYLFFLMFMLMGIAFAIWILPETFGKSLEEMDLVFGSGEGQIDSERMEKIYRSLYNGDESGLLKRTQSTYSDKMGGKVV